jgi:hypothetical protein
MVDTGFGFLLLVYVAIHPCSISSAVTLWSKVLAIAGLAVRLVLVHTLFAWYKCRPTVCTFEASLVPFLVHGHQLLSEVDGFGASSTRIRHDDGGFGRRRRDLVQKKT